MSKLSKMEALAAAGLALDYAVRQPLHTQAPLQEFNHQGRTKKPYRTPEGEPRTLAGPLTQLPALIRYQAKTENALMASVPARIPQMMRQYFGYDPMPWMVADLCAMLGTGQEGIERFKYDDPMPWMPAPIYGGGRIGFLRSHLHGKTSRGMFVNPILQLARDPNCANILVGTNETAGRSQLARIDRFLSAKKGPGADFVRDYPWCAKPASRGSGMKWSSQELWVAGREDYINENPSVYGTGAGDSALRTKRGKTVFDDIEGLGTVTEDQRENYWNWLIKEAWRCMEDAGTTEHPLWLVQGTPFDIDSMYYRVEDRADIPVSTLAWKYPPDTKHAGQATWPARREKVLDMRRSDPEIFAFAMELDPRGGPEHAEALDYKQITNATYIRQSLPWEGEWKVYVALDPAGGSKRRGADYAGLAVGRIKWATVQTGGATVAELSQWMDVAEGLPDPVRYEDLPELEALAVEAMRGLGIYEQCHRAAFYANYYKAPVIIEGNSQQKFHYADVMAQTHPEVAVIIFMSTHEKNTDPKLGVSVLLTMLRAQRFKMIEAAGPNSDAGMRTLRRELRDLDTTKHRHISSALWFIIRHVYEGPNSGPRFVKSSGPRPSAGVRGYGGGSLSHVIDLRRARERLG